MEQNNEKMETSERHDKTVHTKCSASHSNHMDHMGQYGVDGEHSHGHSRPYPCCIFRLPDCTGVRSAQCRIW